MNNKLVRGKLFREWICPLNLRRSVARERANHLIEPLELQEQALRWQETERRVVTVTPETFQKEVTMTAAVTAASVQGETIQGTVVVADLENMHMRKRDVLEMAAGRAVHSENLRFM